MAPRTTDDETFVNDATSEVDASAAPVESNGTNGSAPDLDKLQADFAFRAPVSMRLRAEEEAAKSKVPMTQWLKNIIARELQYSLPVDGQRISGMTEEQKQAKIEAQKAADKAKRAEVKALLEAHREQAKAAAAPAVQDTVQS